MIKKVLLLLVVSITINASIAYKSNFEEKVFLDLNPSLYTINLSTLYSYDKHKEIIKELNTKENLYVFEFGDDKNNLMTKVLFGVFDSYKEAVVTVIKLSKKLRKNKPYINKIGKYQELFNKYHIKKDTIVYPEELHNQTTYNRLETTEEKVGDIQHIDFFTSIDYVLTNHPDIQSQVSLLEVAKIDRDEQLSVFLPTVDIKYERGKTSGAYDSTGDALETDNKSQDITLKWNIFNGFQDYNQYKLKSYKYTSTLFNKHNIVNDFIFKFIISYLELAKIKEKSYVVEDNFKQYSLYLNKMRIKENYGMTSLSDSMSISKQYINSKINYIETRKKKYLDALYDIQNYINIDENYNMLISLKDIDIDMSKYLLDTLLEIASKTHPLILQANSEINLAKMELKKEYKGYMPVFDFIAKRSENDTTYTDRHEVTRDTTIKIQAKMNLFKGGKDYFAIKRRLNEYKQKQFEYKSVVREINYGVKTSFNAYKVLEEKIKLIDKNLHNAEKAYLAAKYDFKFAKIKEDAFIAAVETLTNAKLQSIDFKYDIIIEKYKMLFSTGVLYEQLQSRIKQ